MTDLPPYGRLLQLARGEHGHFTMPFHENVIGRPGYLHGGAIAGLLEFAAFERLRLAIDDERVTMKPVTITVDYLRGAGAARGDTHCDGVIERLGNRIANVDAVAWQTDRAKPVATARITFLLERP
ncbi:PaaI family thioesterase [Sphingomonas sp. HDW15A]|uniref:PaaI family thioesterase n=1 Tax=Sphingomonas sp. HDW15A TaxID=2714942 RepID=UPI001408E022|nr:PaaI family thioesterase [Sphingomonas sp. HDW15A]QIK96499.1 PaaI family thioesterase [Sphingomonas sp. HDW15A]